MTDSDRNELYRAIERHIREYGAKNWNLVKEKFANVPEARFWRSVKKVRTGLVDIEIIQQARHNISTKVKALREAEPENQLASNALGWRNLNLLGKLNDVFEDIALLRSYSLSEDGKIKNPNVFGQTIGMHDKTIATALRCSETILTIERFSESLDAVVTEVAAVDPQLAHRICVRLRELAHSKGWMIGQELQ